MRTTLGGAGDRVTGVPSVKWRNPPMCSSHHGQIIFFLDDGDVRNKYSWHSVLLFTTYIFQKRVELF